MAKAEFPFWNPDMFGKMFGDMKTPGAFDMQRMMKDMKMPNVDMNVMMEAQRKNLDALAQANRLAAEGFQAIARRQAEIMQEGMTQLADGMKDMMAGGSPEANAQRQAELTKQGFERAIANMRELAELAARASSEAYDLINRRIMEGLEELRGAASQHQPAAKKGK